MRLRRELLTSSQSEKVRSDSREVLRETGPCEERKGGRRVESQFELLSSLIAVKPSPSVAKLKQTKG